MKKPFYDYKTGRLRRLHTLIKLAIRYLNSNESEYLLTVSSTMYQDGVISESEKHKLQNFINERRPLGLDSIEKALLWLSRMKDSYRWDLS